MIFIFGAHVFIKGQYLQTFFSFFIFQNFVKRAQNDPKWQEIVSVSLRISGTVHDCNFLVHMCKSFSSKVFHFFKILIYGVFRGVKGQKITQNYQFQYIMLYISGPVGYIIKTLIMISTGAFLFFFKKKCNIVYKY